MTVSGAVVLALLALMAQSQKHQASVVALLGLSC